jgi:hypothetical protein
MKRILEWWIRNRLQARCWHHYHPTQATGSDGSAAGVNSKRKGCRTTRRQSATVLRSSRVPVPEA